MHALILLIAALTPFFASPLLFGLPSIHTTLLPLTEKYFYLLLVPVLWRATLASAELFMRSRPSVNKFRTGVSATLLVFLLLLSLFALQIIRIRFSFIFFVMILATMGLESISVALQKKQYRFSSLTVLALSDLLLAQCSFFLIAANSWQSLVFTIGLTLQICSYRLAALMVGDQPRLIPFLPEGEVTQQSISIPVPAQKFYLLALISGVICTSMLSMTGQLHPMYLALYLLFSLIIPLADLFRKNSADPRKIPDFRAKNGGILLFFIVMIGALTQLL